MKRKVIIGREFDANDYDPKALSYEVEIIEDAAIIKETYRYRKFVWVVSLTLVPIILFLTVAAVIGLIDGSFNELEAVWTAAASLFRHVSS